MVREELECIGVLGEPVLDKSDGVEHDLDVFIPEPKFKEVVVAV